MRERECDRRCRRCGTGSGNNGAPEIVATYDYTDEGGNLLFRCVPLSSRKISVSADPMAKAGGSTICKVFGVSCIACRKLKAQTVCVAEGEKDCDNLTKLGFVATTNPLGAGKWRDEYSETLRGKDVIVFGDVGDDDGAGEKHTQHVIESLTGKAKSIKHVTLPDGFHDVSDYIASLPAETARDTIAKLIDETRESRRVDRRIADDEQADLTSLSSRAVDYPAPPDEAAYYGLAGEIVRRIEPQTEADPVALLVQILVAFGNIIGRNAHAIADGAGIISTVNVSLLGKPAKAAKALRWQHVLRLFAAVDKGWRKNASSTGLSSGEGRDPGRAG